MIVNGSGWRAYMAMNANQKIATDLSPAFDSRADLMQWLSDNGVRYVENGEAFKRAVPYFGELTADECNGPWATACHRRDG
jgi:hypothetical protein